jgi:hypothetical protein
MKAVYFEWHSTATDENTDVPDNEICRFRSWNEIEVQ